MARLTFFSKSFSQPCSSTHFPVFHSNSCLIFPIRKKIHFSTILRYKYLTSACPNFLFFCHLSSKTHSFSLVWPQTLWPLYTISSTSYSYLLTYVSPSTCPGADGMKLVPSLEGYTTVLSQRCSSPQEQERLDCADDLWLMHWKSQSTCYGALPESKCLAQLGRF